MLGTAVGGDLRTIGPVVQWLRDTSMKVHNAAETMHRQREAAQQFWNDGAGNILSMRLWNAERSANDLVDALQAFARLLDDCYHGLERAQHLMAEAESVAEAGGVSVLDHRIVPPSYGDRPGGAAMPIYDQNQLADLYDDPAMKAWYDERCRTYDVAEHLVERACQVLVDLLDRLAANEHDWSSLYFTLGDISRGELALFGGWSADRYSKGAGGARTRAEMHDEWSRRYADDAGRTGDWSRVDDVLDGKAGELERAGRLGSRASTVGVLARVLKWGGAPLLSVGGVVYELSQGEPAQKAVLGGAASAVVSGIGFRALGFFFGPAGWGTILVVGISGFGAGVVSDYLHDKWEPARVKLLREQGGLDPGTITIPPSGY